MRENKLKYGHVKKVSPDSDGDSVRLNKFLSEAGVCSRREADKLIDAKRVTVNGSLPEKGMKVKDGDRVLVDGRRVLREEEEIFLAFNKPAGIVCTSAECENGKPVQNVIDYVNYPKRVYPVGRLDKDSEGLLLLTNNGEVANLIIKGRYGHEKEYFLKTDRELNDEEIRRLEKGIRLTDYEKNLDQVTKPCRIWRGSERKTFHIIIKQGLNRQIRRMFHEAGAEVIYLRRDRIMNIKLGDLRKGRYRKLTSGEIKELKKECGLL